MTNWDGNRTDERTETELVGGPIETVTEPMKGPIWTGWIDGVFLVSTQVHNSFTFLMRKEKKRKEGKGKAAIGRGKAQILMVEQQQSEMKRQVFSSININDKSSASNYPSANNFMNIQSQFQEPIIHLRSWNALLSWFLQTVFIF